MSGNTTRPVSDNASEVRSLAASAFLSGRGVRIWLLSVGPAAVGISAAICIFFLVSDAWKMLAIFFVPPSLLYLWVAFTYWLGYSRVNQADKLATLTATTAIYCFLFPFYGFVEAGLPDRALGLLTLLAILAGALEIKRWRRRVSYLALGGCLAIVGASWLFGRVAGPHILYLAPVLLVQQGLILLVLCLPAELYLGGAGEAPEARNED